MPSLIKLESSDDDNLAVVSVALEKMSNEHGIKEKMLDGMNLGDFLSQVQKMEGQGKYLLEKKDEESGWQLNAYLDYDWYHVIMINEDLINKKITDEQECFDVATQYSEDLVNVTIPFIPEPSSGGMGYYTYLTLDHSIIKTLRFESRMITFGDETFCSIGAVINLK